MTFHPEANIHSVVKLHGDLRCFGGNKKQIIQSFSMITKTKKQTNNGCFIFTCSDNVKCPLETLKCRMLSFLTKTKASVISNAVKLHQVV